MKKEVELERKLKVLANRRRLAILGFLKTRREANVGDISEAIKLSFTSTSKHLTMLERIGFIEKEQRSLNVFYRIASHSDTIFSSIFKVL